jgi:hypothetical protein
VSAVAAFGGDDGPVAVELTHWRSFDAEVAGARTVDHRRVVPPWMRSRSRERAVMYLVPRM